MTRSGRERRRSRRAKAPPTPEPDWAYFFDIDGTLVDIADTPSDVRWGPGLSRLVTALYHSSGAAVALISGRPITSIDRLFPDVRMPAAGQHGVERRDGVGRVSRHAFPSAGLDQVRARLADAVARHPRLLLEDKGLSLALHYRGAPRLGGYAHQLLRSMLALVGAEYCLLTGKRVVEMKPAGRDKGTAVLEFMQKEPFRARIPVFVGDDISDEYGFAVVNHLNGYSVKVGHGPTVARWRLPTVRDVLAWLERGNPGSRPTVRAAS